MIVELAQNAVMAGVLLAGSSWIAGGEVKS
jgi:hypothetical protein